MTIHSLARPRSRKPKSAQPDEPFCDCDKECNATKVLGKRLYCMDCCRPMPLPNDDAVCCGCGNVESEEVAYTYGRTYCEDCRRPLPIKSTPIKPEPIPVAARSVDAATRAKNESPGALVFWPAITVSEQTQEFVTGIGCWPRPEGFDIDGGSICFVRGKNGELFEVKVTMVVE